MNTLDPSSEAEYWKAVAIYLAECHAATAGYDGSLTSTSKSRKLRFADICEIAAKALDGHFDKKRIGDSKDVANRCRSAASEIRGGWK